MVTPVCIPWSQLVAGVFVGQSLLTDVVASDERSVTGEPFDPATRTHLMTMLFGLVLIGIVLLFLVWLGARIVRRYAGFSSSRPAPPTHTDDDWWRSPLVPPSQDDS